MEDKQKIWRITLTDCLIDRGEDRKKNWKNWENKRKTERTGKSWKTRVSEVNMGKTRRTRKNTVEYCEYNTNKRNAGKGKENTENKGTRGRRREQGEVRQNNCKTEDEEKTEKQGKKMWTRECNENKRKAVTREWNKTRSREEVCIFIDDEFPSYSQYLLMRSVFHLRTEQLSSVVQRLPCSLNFGGFTPPREEDLSGH